MTISDSTRADFHALVNASRDARVQVADLIKAGQWLVADADAARCAAFEHRMKRGGAEAHRGETVDFLPTPFLDQGAWIGRAVGRIVVSWGGATDFGTGVLVAPGVVLTNQHVVRSAQSAGAATIEFDFEDDRRPTRRTSSVYLLDPAQGYVASPELGGLDYALVAIGKRVSGPAAMADLPTCPLMDSDDRHLVGMPVNIIQHPGGRHRVVALRANRLLHRATRALLYETDTEPGSSGAPVFNDHWEMVALHHYGEPLLAIEAGVTLTNASLNEGIRVSAIVSDLRERRNAAAAKGESPALVAMADRVLAHGTQAVSAVPFKQLRPRPSSMDSESMPVLIAAPLSKESFMSEVRLVLPEGVSEMTLTLRFGPTDPPSQRALFQQDAQATVPAPRRELQVRSESRRVDRDYASRGGFDEEFLDAMPINLATVIAPKRAKVAPLIEGDDGILRYQHFSVVMHRSRRLAMLTATNIDGATYLSIDRKTGEITPLIAEGETWYTDPRIANEYLVTQEWYSGWSIYFDRGHLTRRNDPTWGHEDDALRAERDTFHFTNCTPQHWRFNQSARHWQGIERYVLEHGLHKSRAALSVLQGPIFSQGDLLADDVLVPNQFWKLLAWRGSDDQPRAVAFVASQQELLSEERGSKLPSSNDAHDVGEFQIAVSELSAITGLDFAALEPWDTFGALPVAGEARRAVSDWSALRINP